MECSDTTALSSYVLVNDTLLVNESSPTEENGALYQSSAGNTNCIIEVRDLPSRVRDLPSRVRDFCWGCVIVSK